MPHGEAWILETLCLHDVPMWCLTRNEEQMREWLMRGSHGLSLNDLREVLNRLFMSGDLVAFYYDDMVEFTPSVQQVDQALSRQDTELLCGASAQGGARWEKLAEVRWDLFYEDSNRDAQSFELRAVTKDRIYEVLAYADILWRVRPNLAAVEFTALSPFRPFRWKELPTGFCAYVQFVTVDLGPRWDVYEFFARTDARRRSFQDWMHSICSKDRRDVSMCPYTYVSSAPFTPLTNVPAKRPST